MGKIFDSTNSFSVFENKSRTPKNMSKNNYYLKNLQNKINDEWKYLPNIIDVEEEKEFGEESYKSLEVKIQNVYDEKLKKTLSDDWKKINFKDIHYPVKIGNRYRFSLNFNDYSEDMINKSIWIVLNTNKTNPTYGAILRRCDSFLTIVSDKGNIHYEPVCLETDFKYSSIYYDLSISIAQGEIYAFMQYNKYTKFIKINDRFVVGPVDNIDRYNNTVYKVKALRRYQNISTFDSNSVPLVFIALEKDDVSADDDFEKRVAKSNGIYREDDYIQKDIPVILDSEKTFLIVNSNTNVNDETILKDSNKFLLSCESDNLEIEVLTDDGTSINERILLNEMKRYNCYLYDNGERVNCPISVETDLLSTDKDDYYYEFIKNDDNSFSILNKKMYLKDELKIRCYYENIENGIFVEKEFLVSLGGLT